MKSKKLFTALSIILLFQLDMAAQAVSQASDPVTIMERSLSEAEQALFHRQYNREIITSRLERLEKKIFGRVQGGSIQHRIDEIIVHQSDQLPLPAAATKQQTVSEQKKDETPPPAPSRFKQNISADNREPVTPEADPQTVEQVSWDASAAIDELLKAEENADSDSLDKAMASLSQIKPPQSDLSPEKLRTASSYYERGVNALEQQKFKDALTNLKLAQSINLWDATTLNDLVRAEINTNDLQAAVLYAPVAILVASSSTIAWCNMAEVFARAKQDARARGCVYLACLMSEDSAKTLATIQNIISTADEPSVRTAFKEGLFIAQYTMKAYVDNKSGNVGQDKEIGPEADSALYKANMLLAMAPGLQQIKPNSGIVVAVTISQSGQVINDEVLRSSGDIELDKSAIKAITSAKLLPLPKSIANDKQQYIVLVDKVVQALADAKHG